MTQHDFDATRRHFLTLVATGAVALSGAHPLLAAVGPAYMPPDLGPGAPFDPQMVVDLAKKLAAAPYVPPSTELPANFSNLDYVQYRDIFFRPDAAVWKREDVPFLIELFHRGFYSRDQINVSIIEDGQAKHLAYSPRLFGFGAHVPRPLPDTDIGFAGLRLSTDVGRGKGAFSEFLVLQGASYFRSIGRDQAYGISARGLALKTGAPEGEEFPIFREFWVSRPKPDAQEIDVYAILDSPSVAGAYHFHVVPAEETVMEIEATLYPRVDLTQVGLAPGTTMFFFDANGRENVDDYRPEVHDSDGLLIYNGAGERLWRPLANPAQLQASAFLDSSPKGFGLMQRNREFESYQDFEGHYEERPSLWVEPIGQWGPGSIMLIEIPSDAEIHDNIVAYWTPKDPIKAGSEFKIAYRLHWGLGPVPGDNAIVVHRTRRGRADSEHPGPVRLFVVDFAMPSGGVKPAKLPIATVTASAGTVDGVTVAEYPEIGGWRLTFHVDPANAPVIELRAALAFEDNRQAETWVYRWTGD